MQLTHVLTTKGKPGDGYRAAAVFVTSTNSQFNLFRMRDGTLQLWFEGSRRRTSRRYRTPAVIERLQRMCKI